MYVNCNYPYMYVIIPKKKVHKGTRLINECSLKKVNTDLS